MFGVQYYEIRPEHDPAAPARPIEFNGRARWALPSRIGCPECGIYGATGPTYPAVDLTGYPDASALVKPGPASWREFAALRERLRPFVPPELPIVPGAEFGPFHGTVRGGWGDFSVSGIQEHLFVSTVALERLSARGAELQSVAPVLRGRIPRDVAFSEVAVPVAGELAPEGYHLKQPAPCTCCERWPRSLERIILLRATAPTTLHLFRPTNHATVLLGSEHFVRIFRALEFVGLEFEPVSVA